MSEIPQCVGIIVDGNRRWAKEQGLPQFEGHRRGLDRVEECVDWMKERGIPNMVAYMFSTENWNRTQEEVSYLLGMLEDMLEKRLDELMAKGVRVRFLGTHEKFSPRLRELMERAEEKSSSNSAITFWACVSYGSRLEITEAVQSLVTSGEAVTEDSIRSHMWSAGMPDPDIIIRTSGEQRLSNFLLWQASYSELFFLKKHWPAFTKEDLDAVLAEYSERSRRRGK